MLPMSYLSPKTEVHESKIHGRGLFATVDIAKDEIVAVKGGHIVDRKTLRERITPRLGPVEIQVDDDLFHTDELLGCITRWLRATPEADLPRQGIGGQVRRDLAARSAGLGSEAGSGWRLPPMARTGMREGHEIVPPIQVHSAGTAVSERCDAARRPPGVVGCAVLLAGG